ncbi:MAG: archease [Betaproteobacteria bacterium]|nr:archease [Betaproteobacteria bacterium]MDE2211529.1 archease [Betaproteobacteria bacterium]MDE2354094.1 archease [Betaproteobacteria bacterium]
MGTGSARDAQPRRRQAWSAQTLNQWEHFPHEADIGVRGRGSSRAEAFEQVALALTAIVVDPQRLHPSERVEFSCKAPDDELLLADWLNAVIYEMATRHFLFCRYRVALVNHSLTAEAWGEPVDLNRHHPVVEPKGATYTALVVRQETDGSWLAQCVVDV